MAKKNINSKIYPQKKHRLGTVSKKITGGLKLVSWYQPQGQLKTITCAYQLHSEKFNVLVLILHRLLFFGVCLQFHSLCVFYVSLKKQNFANRYKPPNSQLESNVGWPMVCDCDLFWSLSLGSRLMILFPLLFSHSSIGWSCILHGIL